MFHRLRRQRSLWHAPPHLTHPPRVALVHQYLAACGPSTNEEVPSASSPLLRPSRALLPPRRLHRLL
ncbi:hypothetical protein FIBSPDRAFT_865090, partial [Athelia psychrophila]